MNDMQRELSECRSGSGVAAAKASDDNGAIGYDQAIVTAYRAKPQVKHNTVKQ